MVLGHNLDDEKRTQDVKVSQAVTFECMLLSQKTLQGLKSAGFYKPSPIQLNGIPLGKCGFDLLLEAKSGTGKTAVFTIIALEKIDLNKGLQVIIIAPTREIAAQICDVIKEIGSHYEELKVDVVMGGLPVQDDILRLKNKVHIIVGSPGRLRHLIQDKHIDTTAVRLLILDEADKLVEKSFIVDINYIFSSSPQQKQVIMSSATYPEQSKPFINKYMQSSQHICPDTTSILLGITQKVTIVKSNTNIVRQTQYRFEELLKILTKFPFKQCLIFCNYQARVAELYKLLSKEKWPAEQLYGQQEQTDRLDALRTLQQYKCRILISTDLAARGIDASNVDLVINFEPPYEWQTYLHRIGRAGRFGSYGTAITMLSQDKEEIQFGKTLNSMKTLLNLTHLWSNKQFVLSQPKLSSESPDIQEDYKKSSDNMKPELKCLTENAFSCLELTDLHQNKESSQNLLVESFSDLLVSFQNDCGDDSQNFDKFESQQSSSSNEKEINLEILNNNNLRQHDKYSSEQHICINQKQEIKTDELQEDMTCENNFYIEPKVEDFELYNLPTSFHSKKYKDHGETIKTSRKMKRQEKLSLPLETSYVHNEQGIKCDKFSRHNNFCNSKSKVKDKCERKYFKKNLDEISYKNWYNQLKFNTKKIEMALYLHEMSSLYC